MEITNLFLRFPDGRDRCLTLSYDDGVETDVRMMEILDRHGIRCTFNMSSGSFAPEGTVYPAGTIHRRMSRSQSLAAYKGTPHEVAVHATHHPFLEQMPAHMATREVLSDRQALEELFDVTVRGMAYPFGATSDEVVKSLAACGIAYARTTVSTGRFDLPADWLRLPATCHHNDPRLFELADEFLSPAHPSRPSRLFYRGGHSYEFAGDDNWDVIERFAAQVGGREEIWYATNLELYDYIPAFNRLVFSVSGDRVENPTAKTVWFLANGETYSVAPGETKKL